MAPSGRPMDGGSGSGLPPEPEISNITFSKLNGSLGLSIVAAKVSEKIKFP